MLPVKAPKGVEAIDLGKKNGNWIFLPAAGGYAGYWKNLKPKSVFRLIFVRF